jgi:hypothetical protein
MDQPVTAPTKCTRCGKPADLVIYRNIVYQAYDQVRNRKVVQNDRLPFCSEEHASHEQMSREG